MTSTDHPSLADPARIVLMGVAGSGKSTVGAALSAATGIAYRDGDDLHTAESIAKMSRGEPLTDEDRGPWLAAVGEVLARDAPLIVGCSALRRRYRDLIRRRAGGPVTFVHLAASREVIAGRMATRTGHFMPPSLIDSQFATLEPPGQDEQAVEVDVGAPLEDVVAAVLAGLAVPAS